ncbi:site-specific DNA-methyltransferase [Metabacillus bambusae]|uniref:Site-specific DNA-methyltransferase n=1 Tax=Metabacillus bambusae TaxID=2795218 RepID=A0ABS3N0D9_9BACI|nr:site-specific DNA-methyltransferase [Metabacillus bambusae]MBO1511540.1 site-specific DNA-methyltransferase [Metabacillus bambusae]
MSTNISKQKREDLLEKINQIKTFVEDNSNDENARRLLSYLGEIQKDINGKKFGLVFEEHKEDIDEKLEENVPVICEEKDLFINNGGDMNFLIEGDNFAALEILTKTHKEKIDLIYIDPPYNTLKEGFTYSDKKVDGNDSFRHSKWLSFMEKRLVLAKSVLSDKGVIFISVDENEFAQLKVLCDEIFGERNFIECLVWNKRVPKNDKGIGNIHEYILLYAKNDLFKYKFMMAKDGLEEIHSLVADCKKKKLSIKETETKLKQLYKKNSYDRGITLYNAVNEDYEVWGKINLSWPNANTFGPRYEVLHPITKKPVKIPERGWRWSEDTFRGKLDYDNIIERHDGSYICGEIWFSKDENMQPSAVKLLKDVDRMLLRSIISTKSDGGIELEKYFGKKSVFAYPKSNSLMKMLIDSITYDNKDCTILDFFAGSGTTAQAILELNSEDNGNRKFILVTNNQNNICRDITYERIKRVIESGELNNQASLKYFKIDFVPITEKLYYEYADELLKYVRELVELEHAINFNENKKIAIILTDEELEEFTNNIEQRKECKTVYLGHDVLANGEQEDVLRKYSIKVHVIPDYYYKESRG